MNNIFEMTHRLIRATLISAVTTFIGLVALAILIGVPILGVGLLYYGVCFIFHLEFSWAIPAMIVILAGALTLTAD